MQFHDSCGGKSVVSLSVKARVDIMIYPLLPLSFLPVKNHPIDCINMYMNNGLHLSIIVLLSFSVGYLLLNSLSLSQLLTVCILDLMPFEASLRPMLDAVGTMEGTEFS